eukprot:m.178436 g.178436  ORF g.178436 m.178436 type:complete len:1379 (+) comp16837_c0_seq1:180-4316(+)
MEQLIGLLEKPDRRNRQDVVEQIVDQLNTASEVTADQASALVDVLPSWVKSSNGKVAMLGFAVIRGLADRLGKDLHPHVEAILPAIIARMVDTKDPVRDACIESLMMLMAKATTPQHIFDKLMPPFKSGSWRVKQAVLMCFEQTLNEHGASSISITRLLNTVLACLTHSHEAVREAAMVALTEAYRHVGARLRIDIEKSRDAPASKLPALLERFEAVRASGSMIGEDEGRSPTPTSSASSTTSNPPPSTRRGRSSGIARSTDRRSLASRPSTGESRNSTARRTRAQSASGPSARNSTGGSAAVSRVSSRLDSNRNKGGGVDTDEYESLLADVSPEESTRHGYPAILQDITRELKLPAEEWEKRMEALKHLRALAAGNSPSFESFDDDIRSMEKQLVDCLADLRSQIVKEACLTVTQLARALGNRFLTVADVLLETLFRQVGVHTKIMADSCKLCLLSLFAHLHHSKLIVRVMEYKDSKSVNQKRICAELLHRIMVSWDASTIQRQHTKIQAYLAQATSDADSDVRKLARRVYWKYFDLFPAEAERALSKLTSTQNKHLQDERPFADTVDLEQGALKRRGSMANSKSRRSLQQPVRTRSSEEMGPPARSGRSSVASSSSEPVVSRSTPVSPTQKAERGFRGGSRRSEAALSSAGLRGPPQRVSKESPSRLRTPSSRASLARAGSAANVPERRRQSSSSPSRIPRTPSGVGRGLTRLSTARGSTRGETSMSSTLAEWARSLSTGDWGSKQAALEELRHALVDSAWEPSAGELTKVTKLLTDRLDDRHHKVSSVALDVLREFVGVYGSDVSADWLDKLLPLLFKKQAIKGNPRSHALLEKTLLALRLQFPVPNQLLVLFAMLLDRPESYTRPVMEQCLGYWMALLDRVTGDHLHAVYDHSGSTYRDGIRKLIVLSDEPKSPRLRELAADILSQHLVTDPGLMRRVDRALEREAADNLRGIFITHLPDWEQLMRPSSNASPYPSHSATPQPSYSPRAASPLGQRHESVTASSPEPADVPAMASLVDHNDPDPADAAYNPGAYQHQQPKAFPTSPAAPVSVAPASPEVVQPEAFRPSASLGATLPNRTPVPAHPYALQSHRNGNGHSNSNGQLGHGSHVSMASSRGSNHSLGFPTDGTLRDAIDGLAGDKDSSEALKNLRTIERMLKDSAPIPDEVLNGTLSTLLHQAMGVELENRLKAIWCLKPMVQNYSESPSLRARFPEVIRNVMEVRECDSHVDVKRGAEDVLVLLTDAMEPVDALSEMVHYMPLKAIDNRQPTTSLALRLANKAIPRCSADQLYQLVPDLLPMLVKTLCSKAAEVRKETVAALVELHLALGEETMKPYLEQTATSHRKLFYVYLGRRQETQENRATAAIFAGGTETTV